MPKKLSGIASSHPASFYGFAAASPFVSLLGGFLVGVTHGAFCSVATRFATGRSLVLEPTIVVLSAYLSYVSAIILSWSGIASIVACGLVQRQYAFDNIRQKSKVHTQIFCCTSLPIISHSLLPRQRLR